MTGERFSLDLPPDPAYVATARIFSAAVARHFDVDEERVEDLKLAVDEACTSALRTTERPLRVGASHAAGRLRFEVSGGELREKAPEDTPTPSPEEFAAGLGLEVVRALFEEAEVVAAPDGGPSITFSVPAGE